MLKMTKRGQLPAERKYTGKCYTCKSEYDAVQGDLTYESDFRDHWYAATCELCRDKVYFSRVLS